MWDDRRYREINFVDFEFLHPEGGHPDPKCLVVYELRSGCTRTFWCTELGAFPPYDTSKNSLFVAFASTAEMLCHLSLGWEMPKQVLDLHVEFLLEINSTPRSPQNKDKGTGRGSLLHALTYYGEDGIEAAEKQQTRELILRGEPYTAEERKKIRDYCESDVRATVRLYDAMKRRGHLHPVFSSYRGRYMRASAKMEFTGVPIDGEA